MASHVMDITWSGQFHIITYLEIDLVIYYLTYLPNQPFKSTFRINLLNESM